MRAWSVSEVTFGTRMMVAVLKHDGTVALAIELLKLYVKSKLTELHIP